MNTRDIMVAWSDSYCLGLDAIDEQHKMLIDLLNRLWSAIINRRDNAEMMAIIDELEKYTISHFCAEEAFMRANGYEDFTRHKKAHDEFVARIAAEKKHIQEGAPLTLDLLKFLKEWLVQHILVSDKAYAAAFAQQKQPESALGRFFKRFWA